MQSRENSVPLNENSDSSTYKIPSHQSIFNDFPSTVSTSESSVNFYQTARPKILEDSHLKMRDVPKSNNGKQKISFRKRSLPMLFFMNSFRGVEKITKISGYSVPTDIRKRRGNNTT